MRLTRFVHAVRTSLWLVPLLCVLAGMLITLGTLWLDRRSGYTPGPAERDMNAQRRADDPVGLRHRDGVADQPRAHRDAGGGAAGLKRVAPPDRQAPLDRQLRLLTAAVRRAYEDDGEIAAALTPDVEGIGSGADVTTTVRLDSRRPDADVRPGSRIPG